MWIMHVRVCNITYLNDCSPVQTSGISGNFCRNSWNLKIIGYTPSYCSELSFQFVEMLIRNLKEALKTGEYDNAKLIVSAGFFTNICKKLKIMWLPWMNLIEVKKKLESFLPKKNFRSWQGQQPWSLIKI